MANEPSNISATFLARRPLPPETGIARIDDAPAPVPFERGMKLSELEAHCLSDLIPPTYNPATARNSLGLPFNYRI